MTDLTPTQVQAQRIAEMQAQLQLAEDRDFEQQAEIARLRSEIEMMRRATL